MTGDEAWADYNANIAKARARMLARPESRHKRVADQAEYAIIAMQAGCHHFRALYRTDYPAFYRQTVWSPYEAAWGGPSSDMVYAWTFLDGRRTYRVWGRQGTTLFTDLQLFNGYFEIESAMRGLGNLDFGSLVTDANGNFEFTMSATKPASGDWLALDPDEPYICAQLRDFWWDWENERGVDIQIECLDPDPDSMMVPAEETHDRLVKSGKLVERTVARAIGYANMNRKLGGGDNQFGVVDGSGSTDHGASSRAGYMGMVWNIEPDEALIIEWPVSDARYWSFQCVDMWWLTMDYSFHQSGLNGHQAETDADGMVRMVLSMEDPGVANWLDPLGTPIGLVQGRWYDGKGIFEAPRVTRMKLSEVAAALPQARRVSREERHAAVARRSKASLKRWGVY